MTDDKRVVEVIAETITEQAKQHPIPTDPWMDSARAHFFGISTGDVATAVLAALRAEGFDVYSEKSE